MLSTIDGILGVFGVGRGILTFSVGFVDFFVCVFFFDRTPTQIPRTVDDTVSMLLDTLKFITPSIIVFPLATSATILVERYVATAVVNPAISASDRLLPPIK